MSAKRITMRQLKEVLRLSFSAGLSIRKISASTKVSVGSIQQILKRAEQLQLSWPRSCKNALRSFSQLYLRSGWHHTDCVWASFLYFLGGLFFKNCP